MKRLILGTCICSLLVACDSQQQQAGTLPAEVNKEEVVVENILNRRSVRSYTDQEVTQEQLEVLMKCAIHAPSANNRQPWEIRVIQDSEILGKIRAINERVTYNAPVVILIAHDTENQFSLFDCGLLTENILLAAESMDLGTVVVGSIVPIIIQAPEAREIIEQLDLPENYEVIVGICVGHKNERPEAKPRDENKIKYIQ